MPFFNNKYRTTSNRLQNWNYSSKGIYFLTICSSNRETIFGSIEESKTILSSKGEIVFLEILKSIKIRKNWIFHSWVIMPNHIHFLIEIKHDFPKWNFSTIKILDDNVDIEHRNLFLNFEIAQSEETHSSASLPIDDLSKNSSIYDIVETHSSASLPIDDLSKNSSIHDIVETHSSASLPIDDLSENSSIYDIVETHSSASSPISFKRKPRSISSFVAQFKAKTTKLINDFDKSSIGSVWQPNYYDRIIWSAEEFQSVYYYIKNNPKNWDEDDLNKI